MATAKSYLYLSQRIERGCCCYPRSMSFFGLSVHLTIVLVVYPANSSRRSLSLNMQHFFVDVYPKSPVVVGLLTKCHEHSRSQTSPCSESLRRKSRASSLLLIPIVPFILMFVLHLFLKDHNHLERSKSFWFIPNRHISFHMRSFPRACND